MKLFSRKALVAAATTAAVSLSGVTVANAETTTPAATTTATSTTTPAAPSTTKTPSKTDEGTSSSDDSEGSSISNMDPKEIRDWIAVFTAVIGALGTAFAFYNKYFAPNAK
ncbi:hypothetical protein MHJ96_06955 [Corynebacterium aurimucosum]|nr:hypothetical protein [Corynebacterium aurimucosum]